MKMESDKRNDDKLYMGIYNDAQAYEYLKPEIKKILGDTTNLLDENPLNIKTLFYSSATPNIQVSF